jgi:hypothetical protein
MIHTFSFISILSPCFIGPVFEVFNIHIMSTSFWFLLTKRLRRKEL